MILETLPITAEGFDGTDPGWPEGTTVRSESRIKIVVRSAAITVTGSGAFDYAYVRIYLTFRAGTIHSNSQTLQFAIDDPITDRAIDVEVGPGGWDLVGYNLTPQEILACKAVIVFGIVDDGGGFDSGDDILVTTDSIYREITLVGDFPQNFVRFFQVFLDCRLAVFGSYHIETLKTTFNTPCAFYGETVVALISGATGLLFAATGTITSIALGLPTVITSAGHGMVSGQIVTLSGLNSVPPITGDFEVTVIDGDNFTVDVNVTVPGDTGTWVNADHTGFQVLGDYATSCIIGAAYSMQVGLKLPIAHDSDDKVDLGSYSIVKLGTVFHKTAGSFTIDVVHSRPGVWTTESFAWAPTTLNNQESVDNRFRFYVGAIAEKSGVSIISTNWYPVAIVAVDFEFETMQGLR